MFRYLRVTLLVAGGQSLVNPGEGVQHVVVASVPLIPEEGVIDILDLGIRLQGTAEVVGHGEGRVAIPCANTNAPVRRDAIGLADVGQRVDHLVLVQQIGLLRVGGPGDARYIA